MQFLSIFRNRKTAAPQTITLAEHIRIVCQKIAEARAPLLVECEDLETELTNARRSNQASMTELMTLRFKNAELVKEIAELKPDAEAHRARLSRDRDYHRNRRSLKTRALSLQPASPAMSESIGH